MSTRPKNTGHKPAYVQKREEAAREDRERQKHAEYIAALNAIPTQLATDENQDQAADTKRRFREWLTIALLGATVFVAGLADWIFYQTMAEARVASVVNTRAWAGPSGAKIDGPVTVNSPVSVEMTVVNTGREPAKNFFPTIITGIWDTRNEDTDALNREVEGFAQKCISTPSRSGTQVLFPSVGFGGGFSFTSTFPKEQIDQAVISGQKILIAVGCLVYDTAKKTRHSTFCYTFKSGTTKPEQLNLCYVGNTAD